MLKAGDVYENFGRTMRVRLVEWDTEVVTIAYLNVPGGWGKMSRGRFATEFAHATEPVRVVVERHRTDPTFLIKGYVDASGRTVIERRS